MAGGLMERFAKDAVICAEGYLQAGAYVPEVLLEHPDLVAGLHHELSTRVLVSLKPSRTTPTARSCG